MKPTVVSCLVLIGLILVSAIQVQAGSRRIIFDSERADSTGKPVGYKMLSFGVEGEVTTLTQKPRRCQLISGVFVENERTEADSMIYVFAAPATDDSVLVEIFLSSHSPREWASIEKGPGARFASLFERGAFLEVSVSKDGKFIFLVDERRHPRMTKMIIVDNGGKVLACRPGLAERR